MRNTLQTLVFVAWASLLFISLGISPALSAVPPIVAPLGQLHEGLKVPSRIDIDNKGNLYVMDARRGAVVCFDKYGALLRSIKTVRPSGGLAVSADGQLFYVASGNAVAILEGPTGKLLGYLGKGAGEFGSAGFIDVDNQ